MKLDTDLVKQVNSALKKEAFVPAPAGAPAGPPGAMPPGAMPPGAMPPGGAMPPMPPGAMPPGAPPMDPTMMGGAPPMPPGAPPGAPPGPPPGPGGPGGTPVTVTLEDLMQLFAMVSQEMGGPGGTTGPGETENPDLQKQVSELGEKVDMLVSMLGGLEGQEVPPGQAGAAVPEVGLPAGLVDALAMPSGPPPAAGPMGGPMDPSAVAGVPAPTLPPGITASASGGSPISKIASAAAALKARK